MGSPFLKDVFKEQLLSVSLTTILPPFVNGSREFLVNYRGKAKRGVSRYNRPDDVNPGMEPNPGQPRAGCERLSWRDVRIALVGSVVELKESGPARMAAADESPTGLLWESKARVKNKATHCNNAQNHGRMKS
ncbi:MAG TPA: hypothetical protein DCE44_06025 [Verrucomicrobiales bacterium]|nr:hypothetical protein [Verrucomicrobiales bacterium]